jgi:hypothetical protein
VVMASFVHFLKVAGIHSFRLFFGKLIMINLKGNIY